MTRISKLLCLLVVGFILCTCLPGYASDSIFVTEVKPLKNIGIFRTDEGVSFDISFSAALSGSTLVTAKVLDIDGVETGVKYTRAVSGNTGCTVELGCFPAGWYRLNIYLGSSEAAEDIYAAFCVVKPPVESSYTFTADLASDYLIPDDRKPDYAEALSRIGIDMVRDRAFWANTDADRDVIKTHVDALNEKDIDILEVWTDTLPTGLKDFTGDLTKVYDMQKGLAEYYDGKVKAWEIINETDLMSGIAPESFAAFYKAAAIGVHDASPQLVKTFGGLAGVAGSYAEILLQNDIISYSDNFNIHTHKHLNGEDYIASGADSIKNAKNLATVYGGGRKQLWITESGISMPVEANDLPDSENLRQQAKYIVSSFARAAAKGGADKLFFFLACHYMENGREFGMTSYNHMPYPAYSSVATLTGRLGDGRVKGVLRNLPEDVEGYLFDNGSSDVAVLWNKTNSTRYVQLKTERKVKITDLVGKSNERRYDPVNGVVNFPVTDSPILIELRGYADDLDYDSISYFRADEVSTEFEANDRVVLQPVWSGDILDGAHIVDAGDSYTVTVTVYNFNDDATSGTVTLNASDFVSVSQAENYSVDANSSVALTFTVDINSDAKAGSVGYISFEGTAGGSDLSSSVAKVSVSANSLEIASEDFTHFDSSYLTNKWNINNRTANSNATISNTLFSSVSFEVSFTEGDKWFYPEFDVTPGTLSNATGITFTRTTTADSKTRTGVFVFTDQGSFHAYAGDFTAGEKQIVIPWSEFKPYSANAVSLEPEKIYQVRVGFNTSSLTPPKYTLSKFGYITTEFPEYVNPSFEITGVAEGAVYNIDKAPVITAEIPSEIVSGVRVYTDYEEYGNFDTNGDILTLNTSELGKGCHTVIISGFDKFGYACRSKVEFYIR